MPPFKISSPYSPSGDQPQAIDELVHGFHKGNKYQTLLGVTGSGKTFTIANVIEKLQKPTLIITHNKTLAAQLYSEFKALFPDNAVEYFVSYYDYYQPEAYLPATDTYIAKETQINEEIERLRLRATSSLISRRDTIVVASVSCIYGLGSPEEYSKMTVHIKTGQQIERNEILKQLVAIQYRRNDVDFAAGCFRVRGDIVEVRPAYEHEDRVVRVQMFGDEIEKISYIDIVRGRDVVQLDHVSIFPARHFVTDVPKIKEAVLNIHKELDMQLEHLHSRQKLLEAQRLESRTKYDMEMLLEIGYCSGIENYSRYFDGRAPGSRPNTLLGFFPNDYLTVIDESHVTLPQVGAMYEGDRSRKEKLVEYGFRLPSALDNRPLKFYEFEELINKAIFLSATPRETELKKSNGIIVELVIRPTGLVDPDVTVKPVKDQIDDLMEEIRICVKQNERVLVTTLTKRMAEHLAEYLGTVGIKVSYLHSEIHTLERTEILRSLRKGVFDVLVGINLLREGLDLPETALVAILDADKEGFLRSTTSLIQTAGRASRNVNGRVILYADTITGSMREAIDEMNRRRKKQKAYNQKHNIVPKTTYRAIEESMTKKAERDVDMLIMENSQEYDGSKSVDRIDLLKEQMLNAAGRLEFEKAAKLRDKIRQLESRKKAK